MFKKIATLIGSEKSSHPLGSAANVERLLEEIPPADPARVLLDVDIWLDDVQRFGDEVPPAALRDAILRLDAFAQPASAELTSRYLAATQREHLSEPVWGQLERHQYLLCEAYRYLLQNALQQTEAGKEKMPLALCGARALRAWATHKKLLHFRYRPPEAEAWGSAHDLLDLCARLGVASLAQKLYPTEEISSPIQNYLAGLYFEMAPNSNLVPLQIEIIARWLQQEMTQLEFSNVRHAGSSHYIDLSAQNGPRRIETDVAAAAGRYFCSLARLRPRVMQLAALLRKEKELPEWIAALEPPSKQLRALPAVLMETWSETPRQRKAARREQQAELKVVQGYTLALRLIAASHFAQKGLAIHYGHEDRNRIYNLSRFGYVDSLYDDERKKEEAVEKIDPLETLLKMETAGDIQMMENWRGADISASGMGVIAPGLRLRHQIGELFCFRENGVIHWRAAILRRIGRDQKKRPYLGLEFLPWPSFPARLRLLLKTPTSGWSSTLHSHSGQYDVILLQAGGSELIVPSGIFKSGQELQMRTDQENRLIRLGNMLDHGEDWERIEFSRLDAASPDGKPKA